MKKLHSGQRFLCLAHHDLRALVDYLVDVEGHDTSLHTIRVKWCAEQEEANRRDPRAFCHVRSGEPDIHCAMAIEKVSQPVRLGILLHELAHLGLNAMRGAESEVDVDEWILAEFPWIGYRYVDHFYSSPYGTVNAPNVQTVSGDFVERLPG